MEACFSFSILSFLLLLKKIYIKGQVGTLCARQQLPSLFKLPICFLSGCPRSGRFFFFRVSFLFVFSRALIGIAVQFLLVLFRWHGAEPKRLLIVTKDGKEKKEREKKRTALHSARESGEANVTGNRD